jgi:acetamidase/formamidase/predicted SnoaL-like aldol condensation-catalyzing enzyme
VQKRSISTDRADFYESYKGVFVARSASHLCRAFCAILVTLSPVSILCAQQTLPQQWVAGVDFFGNHRYQLLFLASRAGRLEGTFGQNALTGALNGSQLRFTSKDQRGQLYEVTAQLAGDTLTGELTITDTAKPPVVGKHVFSAHAILKRPDGPPRTIDFQPTSYSNQFSADVPAVLTIWPGDTIHTTTVDSGGVDEHGITRALFGNPQTGPFYVGPAKPGDVLAVHIKRLRLNRDYADSLDAIASRIKDPNLAVQAKDLGRNLRWHLDLKRNVASPANASENLKNFSVPLRPMLGCVAVAPDFGFAPFSTGDAGRYGGNMDYNDVVEGSTVYLEVTQPGALLYIGDGHAAMGDGETTEWALETSMEVEFSVDVIPGKFISTPRVETASHIAAVGLAGSIDDATKMATSGMVQWLSQDYHLTPSESAQVLGSMAEYTISEVPDRNAGVVLRLRKDLLQGLGPALGSSSTAVAQEPPVPSECSTAPAELQAEKDVVLDFYRPGITLRQLIALIDPSYVQHNPLALKFAQEKHINDYEEFKQLFSAVAASANTDSKNILDAPARRGGRAPHVVILIADCDLVTAIVQYTRPDPTAPPGTTYERFAFDTFRVRGGKLVEHWDDEEITPESVEATRKREQQSPHP